MGINLADLLKKGIQKGAGAIAEADEFGKKVFGDDYKDKAKDFGKKAFTKGKNLVGSDEDFEKFKPTLLEHVLKGIGGMGVAGDAETREKARNRGIIADYAKHKRYNDVIQPMLDKLNIGMSMMKRAADSQIQVLIEANYIQYARAVKAAQAYAAANGTKPNYPAFNWLQRTIQQLQTTAMELRRHIETEERMLIKRVLEDGMILSDDWILDYCSSIYQRSLTQILKHI